MRITDGGNVGIGTTSPSERLHVAGSVRIVDGNQGASKVLTSDANGVASWQPSQAKPDYILISHELSDGTHAGTLTANTWNLRYFNTEKFDEGNHAAVNGATGIVTLQPGTYICTIESIANRVGAHQARLYNVTTGAVQTSGTNGNASNDNQGPSIIRTKFTLAEPTQFRVEHNGEGTRATDGMGFAGAFTGTPETFGYFECYRY
jgi:hypothetical protein